MLIILEGVDGAGKTTLARRLADHIRKIHPEDEVRTLHRGPIEHDPLTEYEDELDDYRPGSRVHVICDRWHLGELVYGPVLRGTSRMTEAETHHIDMFLAARGAIVARLTAPREIILDRLRTRGDDLVSVDLVDAIERSYDDVIGARPWATETITLPWTETSDVDHLAGLLIGRMMIAEVITRPLANGFPTYVGPRRPTYLLLGERRNVRKGPGRSAFIPRGGTSGAYLLDSLPIAMRGQVGIANACEENVVSLVDMLAEPRVVALGKEARRECERAELLRFGAVPHPQYVRRFHNSRKNDYGAAIYDAAKFGGDYTHVFAHPAT